MPRSRHQKLKALYILDFLSKHTDEYVGVTVSEIIDHLKTLGIESERKSVYEDIAELADVYGADIVSDRNGYRREYKLLARGFEAAELRLLMDAVQASKFITRKKSDELIAKLRTLAGPTASRSLAGQVMVTGRIKSMEETIYYNVDRINRAISDGKKITFNYFVWMPDRSKALRRDGGRYMVSPLSLCWSDENYYLIADEDGALKHFRVDKMQRIHISDTARDENADFDADSYGDTVFGMFGGEAKNVTFRCKNHLAGAVIDRFGKGVMTVPDGDSFTFTASVRVSPQFFGWVCGFGDDIKIESPADVAAEFVSTVEAIVKAYK